MMMSGIMLLFEELLNKYVSRFWIPLELTNLLLIPMVLIKA